MPDVQCAWQIILGCAGPRCHHLLRTIPPSQSAQYAQGHDDFMWRAVEAVMGRLPGDDRQKSVARLISTLPRRLGGPWFAFRPTYGPGSILGFVGRLFGHVFQKVAGRDCTHHGEFGERSRRRWMFGRVAHGEQMSGPCGLREPGRPWTLLRDGLRLFLASLASGSVAGSITRHSLLNITTGRP